MKSWSRSWRTCEGLENDVPSRSVNIREVFVHKKVGFYRINTEVMSPDSPDKTKYAPDSVQISQNLRKTILNCHISVLILRYLYFY